VKILKLDFKKTSDHIDTTDYGHIDLSDKTNIKNIEKYILPIISENEGWDTADITVEKFQNNPLQYQESLDASLFANVHVALGDLGEPLGLIEFLEETLDSPLSVIRMNNLKELITSKSSWSEPLNLHVVDNKILDKYFKDLESYFQNKYIYSEIGITVKPELQGKKSGVSQYLYNTFQEGILFGWTNNPLLLAQWKGYFNDVIYFPLLREKHNSLEYLASLAILYADLLTYDRSRWTKYEFGALYSEYFITKRSNNYLTLAQKLVMKGKLTNLDKERIQYCLERKSVEAAIFAFN
jgi:hypothetical protein